MFKSVEYAGFDEHPGLKVLAERGTQILSSEMGTWHDSTDVIWEAYPDTTPALELTVTVTLSIGSGTGTRLVPVSDFADEDRLRSRCGGTWARALRAILDKRKHVWDEIINQPVGA